MKRTRVWRKKLKGLLMNRMILMAINKVKGNGWIQAMPTEYGAIPPLQEAMDILSVVGKGLCYLQIHLIPLE